MEGLTICRGNKNRLIWIDRFTGRVCLFVCSQGRAAVHDAGADPALGGAIVLHLGLAILHVLLHTLVSALLRAAQPRVLPIPPLPPHEPTGMCTSEFISQRETCT